MPRFHFNTYGNRNHPDDEGVELPSWAAARHEAVRMAGLLIADGAERVPLEQGWHMEVTDERGRVLFRVDFTVV
ncbi:hypothetical protein VQ03_04200 [Methylobacterium tarhaniae]|uniref:DUF6894 domain-containing protein n=1 Tax=Methylobacterium tarhaniae TaxID=1187852 RepID=A0A0J6TA12_9HYPH|nr:hypothetical protein VQ03_04200 [Methylobacterium tarhaniae]